jgi:hypothetical protein
MFKNLAKKIQNKIVKNQSIQLHFNHGPDCDVFPHRLVYLDGVLSVIGEDIHNKFLKFFPLVEIASVDELQNEYIPNLSQIEVNEFITDLRMINGRQERLVIKIYAKGNSDVLPEFHYLHNPYVTTNLEGDMIWAATIEMCDEIYQWLYEMKDQVEILDPGFIRKEFASYCEDQKAS